MSVRSYSKSLLMGLIMAFVGLQIAQVQAQCGSKCGSCNSGCNSGGCSPGTYGPDQTIMGDANAESGLTPSDQQFNLGEAGPAQLGNMLAVTDGGYIDSAIVRTRFRLRYDRMEGGDSDRAGFLYSGYNVPLGAGTAEPFALAGPTRVIIQNYDYHEVSGFLEYKLADRFSVFAEIPVRWTDIDGVAPGGTLNGNLSAGGLSDINAGLRYALIQDCFEHLTFQLKVFTPTGDAGNALGVGHTSIQPGVLYQRDYEKASLFGEIHDWIGMSDLTPTAGTFTGTNFVGNVLRIGGGGAYHVVDNGCYRISAVGEVVMWSVLDGLRTDINGVNGDIALRNATGDTIVNAKLGARYVRGAHSIYVGYGFPLTGDQLYDDLIRADYTYNVW